MKFCFHIGGGHPYTLKDFNSIYETQSKRPVLISNTRVSIKLRKSEFCSYAIKYLGFINPPEPLVVLQYRIDQIGPLKSYKIIKELQSSVGLWNLFGFFMAIFVRVPAQLNMSQPKDQPTHSETVTKDELLTLWTFQQKVITLTLLSWTWWKSIYKDGDAWARPGRYSFLQQEQPKPITRSNISPGH